MDEDYDNLNQALLNNLKELEITNLVGIQNHYDDNSIGQD